MPRRGASTNWLATLKAPRKSFQMGSISGSASLIGYFEIHIDDKLTRSLFSCLAPAVIELFLFVYSLIIVDVAARLDQKQKRREREVRQREDDRLMRETEELVRQALEDNALPETEKTKLLKQFAKAKLIVASKAVTDLSNKHSSPGGGS